MIDPKDTKPTHQDSNSVRDHQLGMHRDVTRRDFLNGVAVGVGGAIAGTWISGFALAEDAPSVQDAPGYYPPTRTGMRGSHPGAFETAHSVRDGNFLEKAGKPVESGEIFDLVIVGGGISGLAAAYFYRKQAPSARILILDNHDDFGGHAKRNEFRPGGRLLLTNGGTVSIESPFPYSKVAAGLMTELGIDPPAMEKKYVSPETRGLGSGFFFDKETFGTERLVTGAPGRGFGRQGGSSGKWAEVLAKTTLSAQVQQGIVRIQEGKDD